MDILERVAEHNASQDDAMRRFDVRIGINENIDNVVTDVNHSRNVAGAGISMAQRIMDKADGGQVLIGESVHEVLAQRESYMSTFRKYLARGKHGIQFPVYQYIGHGRGLSTEPPATFVRTADPPPQLTPYVAYYLAYAVANRDFIVKEPSPGKTYFLMVLLHLLAEDAEQEADTPSWETSFKRVKGGDSFAEQFAYYAKQDYWLVCGLSDTIERTLAPYAECFEKEGWRSSPIVVSETGIARLLSEQPDIAASFGLLRDAVIAPPEEREQALETAVDRQPVEDEPRPARPES